MTEISDLLSFKDLNFVLMSVLATSAGAQFITSFSLSKALAIEFEAIYFGAFAATVAPWREVKFLDYFRCLSGERVGLMEG